MAEKKQSAVRHVLPMQPPGAASCSFGRLHTNCAAICQSDPLPHLAARGLDPCLVFTSCFPPRAVCLVRPSLPGLPPPPDSSPSGWELAIRRHTVHVPCAMLPPLSLGALTRASPESCPLSRCAPSTEPSFSPSLPPTLYISPSRSLHSSFSPVLPRVNASVDEYPRGWPSCAPS